MLITAKVAVSNCELLCPALLLLLLPPQLLQLLQKSLITSWCTSRGLRISWSLGGSWRERERREGAWRGSRERLLIGAGLAMAILPGTGGGVVREVALNTRLNFPMAKVRRGRRRDVAVAPRAKSHLVHVFFH